VSSETVASNRRRNSKRKKCDGADTRTMVQVYEVNYEKWYRAKVQNVEKNSTVGQSKLLVDFVDWKNWDKQVVNAKDVVEIDQVTFDKMGTQIGKQGFKNKQLCRSDSRRSSSSSSSSSKRRGTTTKPR